jgi:hypothetical protein
LWNFVTETAVPPAVMKCGPTTSVTHDAAVVGGVPELTLQMLPLAARLPAAKAS